MLHAERLEQERASEAAEDRTRAFKEAREARARQKAAAAASQPSQREDPLGYDVFESKSHPSTAARPRPSSTAGSGAGVPTGLLVSHRSVQLAHSLGLLLAAAGLPLALLFSTLRVGVLLVLAGVGLARGGGAWLHTVLPHTLQAGSPPRIVAASDGLFTGRGPLDASNWAVERACFLESLAFVCTYGKKNCLTQPMYDGKLTFDKIWRLVSGKLREGVVQC